jgi:hypothetical protein
MTVISLIAEKIKIAVITATDSEWRFLTLPPSQGNQVAPLPAGSIITDRRREGH